MVHVSTYQSIPVWGYPIFDPQPHGTHFFPISQKSPTGLFMDEVKPAGLFIWGVPPRCGCDIPKTSPSPLETARGSILGPARQGRGLRQVRAKRRGTAAAVVLVGW